MAPMAYLDHAASTPMRPEAVAAMLPFLTERYANPSGGHALARDARRAIDEARDDVARCLGVDAGEVVFCGDGTEADNMAVFGVMRRAGDDAVAVCSAIEHHAVLHPVEHTGGRVVGVDRHGRIDLDRLADALDGSVKLVSVMAVNNEVGSVQPLAEVAALVRERAPDALLHTDAIQVHQWLDTAEVCRPFDLASISGHKFGGPKGAGVLIVRKGVTLEPLVLGGGQERDRRSGTQNVAGIAALATAMVSTAESREVEVKRLGGLRDDLVDGLAATIEGLVETVPRDHKVAGNAHVCIEGVESEAILYLLEKGGVFASAGSSCSSGAISMSHVLTAMGVEAPVGIGAVRLTFGWASTAADVERALEVLPAAVAQLRRKRSP
ncbi:MAG: cysteine desulfurase family protein [Acidimicrobiales bacterium]